MRRATLKLKSSLLAVTEQLKRQFPEQKTKELGRNDHRISVRKSCSRPKADMKGEDFDSSNPCRNRRVTGNPKFRLETANGAQKRNGGVVLHPPFQVKPRSAPYGRSLIGTYCDGYTGPM
jgi:hypothetical protein